jgi:uncharacterized protein (TIGR02217 family)
MATITPDTTPIFPACPAYGFRSDPYFLVKIVAREGGFELVDRKWSQPLRTFDGTPLGDRAQEDIEEILYFWLAVGGISGQFRFRDYTDYKSCRLGEDISAIDQVLVALDTSPVSYQLTKTYTVGALTHSRPIRRPRGSSVRIANEVGAEQSDWTLDEATGVIVPGGAFAGVPTAAGFLFDVLCRFNSNFSPQITNHEIQSAEVSLVEKREAS